ncbi:MAG: 50S ribosome-binding GTPase [Clostridia bacterium]|nr:50S ribosome-binding GTPase [Clostridia bacterium]
MDEQRRMNILVLGNSGAGKSTLIKAISGTEVQTGVGEGNTQNIAVYESSTWPLRFIDTKGFEYSRAEQRKTIKQVMKFTKEQIARGREESIGIDAVWYCVEGTARRTFAYNVEMLAKATKKWNNVPVFAVITKSYSAADIDENVRAVAESFAAADRVNLQRIIPVVAEPYAINEETVVEPMGIDELCNATLDVSETALRISGENRYRMILEQKRFNANMLTTGATATGVVVGAVPISFADSLILVPLEIALTKGILKVYDVEFSGDLITSIVGSTAITNVARAVLSSLKAIPNIPGSVLNAVVAGVFIGALGEAVIALSEAIYLKKLDKDKLDGVVDFVTDKLKSNPALRTSVKYLEGNAEKLQGKSAKEIYKMIEGAVKKQK